MATFQQLKEAVTRNTDVDKSAILFINGIIQQLKDAGTEEERQAVIDELETHAAQLAAAITANTGGDVPESASKRR